jgi:hypothetical protein
MKKKGEHSIGLQPHHVQLDVIDPALYLIISMIVLLCVAFVFFSSKLYFIIVAIIYSKAHTLTDR